MVNVFNQIKELLVFESSDDFYYLQILQRKKDNPHIGSNSKTIKNYYIHNIEYLEHKWDEIESLCKLFNARAMLRLNKRSYAKVAFKTMQNIANTMSNGEYGFIKNAYSRACGLAHHDKNKTWVIDIDGVIDETFISSVIECINSSRPLGEKVVTRLPTKNGIHLIAKPFDLREFRKVYSTIDIHKDNPINLYIP